MTKASRVHANTRRTRRNCNRIFMPFWIAVVSIMTLEAAVNTRWEEALLGVGMIAAGLLFWLVMNVLLDFISWLDAVFYGPEPEKERNED